MYTSLSKQSDNDNCHKKPLPTPAWDMDIQYISCWNFMPISNILWFQLRHQTNVEIFRSYYPAAARPKTI